MSLEDLPRTPPPGWERVEKDGRVFLLRDRSRAMVDGKPYFEHPDDVRRLKREGRLDEAAVLLLRLIAVVEDEAEHGPWGAPHELEPWYYEQLAIVRRKQKRHGDEVFILQRYIDHPNAIPVRLPDFKARRDRALQLLDRFDRQAKLKR